jgi:hypothetical protein
MPALNPLALLSLTAIGGAAIYVAEPDILDTAIIAQPGVQTVYDAAPPAGYQAEPIAYAAPACGVEISAASGDGRLIQAWADSAALPGGQGSYRLDLNRRTGGGGFDMAQEGAVPADPYAPQDPYLSEVWINNGERVSGVLRIHDSHGALICEYRL